MIKKILPKYGEELEVVCVAVIKNMCCANEPVLVIRNHSDEGGYYARCTCDRGLFETEIKTTVAGALIEYEELEEHYLEFVADAAEYNSLCCIPKITVPMFWHSFEHPTTGLPISWNPEADQGAADEG